MAHVTVLGIVSVLLMSCGGGGGDVAPPVASFQCDTNAVPKGSRLLGLDFLSAPENGDFSVNTMKFRDLGGQFMTLHVTWAALEPLPSTFTDPANTLATVSSYIAANNIKLALTLRPIDLTGKTVPSDLSATRFSDPNMIARFNALMDFVFTKIDRRSLTSLQIGNEIDGFDTRAENPNFWSDYGAFLFAINTHAKSNYPGLRIGFTATWSGLVQGSLANQGVFDALLNAVDVLGVTYYPLNANFTARQASDVHDDMKKLLQRYPNTTIHVQEVGYPSATANTSNETQQAMFFCELFKAWDTHSARISHLSILRLNDVSRASAQTLAGPYGISSDAFIEYLRSLGLRRFSGDGQDKSAFRIVMRETGKRGWH